jgi:hypothetical protein
MDKKFKNGLITGLAIAGVIVIFFAGYRTYPAIHPCPPKGQTLVPQLTWDSVVALGNKLPEVHIDTVWLEKPVVTPPQPPIPTPTTVSVDTNTYADSLVNREIHVHYDFKVKGTLLSRNWSYRPIVIEIRRDSIVSVPKLIPIDRPVETLRNGLYVYGVAGGNLKSFLPGAGIDFITKKGTEIGAMYQRFGKDNFYSVKLGIILRVHRQ